MFASINAYLTSGGLPPGDPYFNYVTALLPGNGTNGAQNNTFLDSSSNAFTITRNGNTTQGTFSPYGSLWSNYFNGSSRLTGASSISTGTGDFTVECWANITAPATGSIGNLFLGIGDEQTGTGCTFYQYQNSIKIYGATGVGTPRMSISYTFTPNAWYHIAFVRSSGTITAYVNGVSIGTASASGSGYAFSGVPIVSGLLDTGTYYNGDACYISNVRVTTSALYTSTFTPSTTPLTAISGTVFLSAQSNRFIDNSFTANVLSTTGTPSVQRFSPFNPASPYSTNIIGGSGYFDGTGDYLTSSATTALNFGTGDFTIEFWAYLSSATTYQDLFGDQNTSGGVGIALYNGVIFYGDQGISNPLSSSYSGNYNQWTHIAVSRSSGTSKMFFNGALVSSSSDSINYSSSTGIIIGKLSSRNTPTNGYLSNLRVVKGTAVYTSAFTPPSAPLTAITNTSLLTNFTNAGIIDSAEMNDLETVGNAQISTAQYKYGGSSIAFDGSGDYLLSNSATTDLYAFGAGDFTVEFWIYFNSVSGVIVLYDPRNSSETNCPVLYMSSGTLLFYVNGVDRASGGALTTNTWYHVALCRNGSSTKLFVNGVQPNATYTDTNNYTCQENRPVIGANGFVGGGGVGLYPLNGYIDDLRVTKGYARYTSNFTPPTTALPTY